MSTLKVGTIADTSGSNGSIPAAIYNGRAKAWVNFNGTTTTTIRDSYNVSSITDTGTGACTVNFTNAMADANYAILSSGGRSTASGSVDVQAPTGAVPTVNSFNAVYAYGGSSSPSDTVDYVFFVVFSTTTS